MNNQHGQSMAEFSAGVAVLAMLMLGCISVAGIQEVQRRAIAGAREAAFQQAWLQQRGVLATLREQVAGGHFDDHGLLNATGSARLVQSRDIELAVQSTSSPGTGAAALRHLFDPLRAVSGFLGSGFDLQDDGFLVGSVGGVLDGSHHMPPPFDSLSQRFEQPFALLGDDWSAAGPAHVARRAGGLVPTHLLTPLSAIWRPLSVPLSLFEPSLRELCFGLIEPDRVPEDRLGPGRAQGVASCP